MVIDIYNTLCKVHGEPVEEAWLRSYLSFDDQSTAFRKTRDGRAKHVAPKKIYLYDILEDTFPTGLLSLVYKKARGLGYEVSLRDCRADCPKPIQADLSWLRDYQLEAVQTALRIGRGILHEATGSGKSHMAAGIIMSIPVPWVFIVHRSGLMYQAKHRFEECGIRGIGLVGDGNLEIGSTVTVATFQTLATKLNDPQIRALRNNARGMIIDELHVAASDTWSQTSMAFTEAHYRFGLSGTPLDRSDKRSLIAVGTTGPVIHHTATETLVQSGVLAKPIVFMVKVEQELTKPTYAGLYGEAVIRSSKRNAALVEMTRLAEKPTLVFITNLKHGNALVAALQKAGLSVAFVQGSMEESQRGNLKNQLLRKEIDVIVSSVVWQEGIDLPELASVIVAGAGRSVIASLQRVGRGMRRAAGKETFEVWDVADVGTRIFENHTKARIAAYRREEFEVRFVDLQSRV